MLIQLFFMIKGQKKQNGRLKKRINPILDNIYLTFWRYELQYQFKEYVDLDPKDDLSLGQRSEL